MSITSVLIGEGCFLHQCAEQLGALKLPVAAIATRDQRVANWARANAIAVVDSRPANPLQLFAGVDFDILWSVGSADLIDQSVIARARHMALEFRDGRWRSLAGFSASCEPIVVDPDGTTSSHISKRAPRSHEHRERERSAPLTPGGWIVPSSEPEDIEQLVRRPEDGTTSGPLGVARLIARGRVFSINSAERLAGASRTAPNGTILAREQHALVVAFAGRALRLAGLSTAAGEPVDAMAIPELAPGSRLDETGDAAHAGPLAALIGPVTIENRDRLQTRHGTHRGRASSIAGGKRGTSHG